MGKATDSGKLPVMQSWQMLLHDGHQLETVQIMAATRSHKNEVKSDQPHSLKLSSYKTAALMTRCMPASGGAATKCLSCVFILCSPRQSLKGLEGPKRNAAGSNTSILTFYLPSCYATLWLMVCRSSSSSTSLATVCCYKVYRAAQQILLKSQGLAWLQDTLDVPGSLDHRSASGTWAEPSLCCDVLQ